MNSRVKVKVCGITSVADAQMVCAAGVDYLGLNLFAGPRRISLEVAREIARVVPSRVKVVVLTTSPTRAHPEPLGIGAIAEALPRVDVFQLYGPGPFEDREKYAGGEYWIVTHIDNGAEERSISERLDLLDFVPHGMLADRKVKDQLGGTGVSLDWAGLHKAYERLRESRELPKLVLAGGLTAGNVRAAIELAYPAVVDVSSGVELAGEPGKKDAGKVRDFVLAAKG